jgi:predicted metalloprotease with PDZ domain
MTTRSARARLARALCLLVLAALAAAARAQDANAPAYKISYTLSMPDPASHLFNVRVDVQGAGGAEYVDFQMPRWSPGRYAVFEFAKNVQEAKAMRTCLPSDDCITNKLPVERLDTQTWRVRTKAAGAAPDARPVSFFYKVYADDLSGTFSQLDQRHANFNGGSVFVYVAGHKQDAVTLRIDAPKGWKVFNGQSKNTEQTEFGFADYDLLIDTPTEVAPGFNVETFEVGGKTYRVVVHSFGDEGGKRGELVKQVERVVRAETALMPAPDYEQYTFLFHFDPTSPRGDGMEHLTSTQIVETSALGAGNTLSDAVGAAAHEFFHVWNVKRLRPAGLGPWDFTRPVVTRGLWVAEGFTNYYGKLAHRRAGLWDDEQLLRAYSGAVGYIENQPGVHLTSAVEASVLAPFIDRASHDQKTNLPNVVVSYYPKGETIALTLDLLIRGRTKGRASLDDVMRRAYTKFYLESPRDSYYLKGHAYAVEEFEGLASEVAGLDLSDFFRRYVHDTETLPYEEALRYVGLRLTRTPEAARTTYRIEKDDKATPEALALREAWLNGK